MEDLLENDTIETWLREHARLPSGWRIEQIDEIPESSDSVFRVFLDWPDDEPDPEKRPTSLIVKTASPGNTRRQFAEAFGMAHRECTYYNMIASYKAVPSPRCIHASPEGDSLLILEDLGRYRQGDQVAGYEVAEVLSAMRTILPMHAGFAGHVEDEMPLGQLPRPDQSDGLAAIKEPLRQALQACIADPELDFKPDTIARLEHMISDLPGYAAQMVSAPMTLVHGDYRFANILFDKDDQVKSIIDWQLMARGNPMIDIAYLISQGGEAAIRHQVWPEVRAVYQKLYTDRELPAEKVQQDYEIGTVWAMIIPMLALAIDHSGDTDLRPFVLACLRRGAETIEEFETP